MSHLDDHASRMSDLIERFAALIAAHKPVEQSRDRWGRPIVANATARVRVRRDVRLFEGVQRKRLRPGTSGAGALFDAYQREQLRLFEETHIEQVIEVALIDERDSLDLEAGIANFRLELAEEQHLWCTHREWGVDPVPTMVASLVDADCDPRLVGCAPYELLELVG